MDMLIKEQAMNVILIMLASGCSLRVQAKRTTLLLNCEANYADRREKTLGGNKPRPVENMRESSKIASRENEKAPTTTSVKIFCSHNINNGHANNFGYWRKGGKTAKKKAGNNSNKSLHRSVKSQPKITSYAAAIKHRTDTTPSNEPQVNIKDEKMDADQQRVDLGLDKNA
ncbi:hypothetical protein CHS0354_017398 [Potamilus streckersoni]|uniref:Uncharacterized protein n=1 Tax=Potamilus streckersoni TaxID=2493646 RepID=A0AAE0TIF7_9BIVA|nr:hypothetical protein CHS0354_017398 [Potamilus streckersoni]